MRVRLLGPIDVLVHGRPQPVAGLRRKAVLASLALHSGEVVSTDRLMDIVWPEQPRAATTNNLQSHMSHLRRALQDKMAIRAQQPGYLLDIGDDGTDVQVAERLLAASRHVDPAGRVRLLREAMALWRGRPLADVIDLPWLEEQAERLDLLGTTIRRALLEARVEVGEHAAVVADLERAAADYPLDERIGGQLMLALYRCGRQAAALDAYQRLRRALSHELGTDPGTELRELHAAVLRQDPALAPPAPPPLPDADARPAGQARQPAAETAGPGWTPTPIPAPAQLPLAVPAFAGRSAELASLDAMLPGPGQAGTGQAGPGRSAAVLISAVSGTAGVGKTALAVHWAHRVAGQFPDGQLYINLRGFDPGGAAVEPGEALREFLDALGVPRERIPENLAARTGLYRSLLAERRVLVLLDNARTEDQVRPLLPGSPGSVAIVTSRSSLAGLVATEGARPLQLDLLDHAGGRAMLACRLGRARLDTDPDAVEEIISRCARLPLALAITATRAAINPGFPLAAVAGELCEAGRALDPFAGGDPATDVRAVFSWSYRSLSAGAARLFRLVGLHPGPAVSVAAAASLAAVAPGQARAQLAELTRACLLSERTDGRYACHDLLAAYATELAQASDDAGDRQAAVDRAIEHYLHTARDAAALLEAPARRLALEPPRQGVVVGELAAAEHALGWFAAEHATLLSCARIAAASGARACAWQLAWTMTTFHLWRGLWTEHAAAQASALAAARAASDLTGQAYALFSLGLGDLRLGRFDAAQERLRQALTLFEETGDRIRQATIHQGLAQVARRQRRHEDMLSHSIRALELFRAAGDRDGMAVAADDIGISLAVLGNYQSAMVYCQQGLAAARDRGERAREADILDSIGFVHHQLGDDRQAMSCYQAAADICRELGDRYHEASAMRSLGDAAQRLGDGDAARQAWTHARWVLDELGHPDAADLRDQLGQPSEAAGGLATTPTRG
jgi:DNA-binding SARP family transcriptional activator/tetratricopeptide (TPR) repeat protein